MIPSPGCDPNINVLVIGAKILDLLFEGKIPADEVLLFVSKRLHLSMDHVILSLDWLYSIKAIHMDSEGIYLNEAN